MVARSRISKRRFHSRDAAPAPRASRPIAHRTVTPPSRSRGPRHEEARATASPHHAQGGSSHCIKMTIFRTRGEVFAVTWPQYTKKAQVGFIAIPQNRPRNSDNRHFVPKGLLFERANRRQVHLRGDRPASASCRTVSPPALPSRSVAPLRLARASGAEGQLLLRTGAPLAVPMRSMGCKT